MGIKARAVKQTPLFLSRLSRFNKITIDTKKKIKLTKMANINIDHFISLVIYPSLFPKFKNKAFNINVEKQKKK